MSEKVDEVLLDKEGDEKQNDIKENENQAKQEELPVPVSSSDEVVEKKEEDNNNIIVNNNDSENLEKQSKKNGLNSSQISPFYIMSILSWGFVIINEVITLKYLTEASRFITIEIIAPLNYIFPLQIKSFFLVLVFFSSFIITLFSFVIFLLKTTLYKDGTYEKLFNKYTRFHFIALILFGILLTIGTNSFNQDFVIKEGRIAGFIFGILSLGSIVFIYIMTDLSHDYLSVIIKKGFFSSIIAILWYYLLYDIGDMAYQKNQTTDVIKNCSLIFSILLGIGAGIFSFAFKDLFVSYFYILIEIGCIWFFFKVDKEKRKTLFSGPTEGILEVFELAGIICVAIYLLIKQREQCLK